MKLMDYNLTKRDLEELYGNKASAGLVMSFGQELVMEAIFQTTFNEIRRHFHFKPQKMYFNQAATKEALEDPNADVDCKTLDFFQRSMNALKQTLPSHKYDKFTPEDIDTAERFLTEKFPEIHQIFAMRAYQFKDTTLTEENLKQAMNDFYSTGFTLFSVIPVYRYIETASLDNRNEEPVHFSYC